MDIVLNDLMTILGISDALSLCAFASFASVILLIIFLIRR